MIHVAGYTLAANSIVGFKVVYRWKKAYVSKFDSRYNTSSISILTIELIYPNGTTNELEQSFDEQQSKFIVADTELLLQPILQDNKLCL